MVMYSSKSIRVLFLTLILLIIANSFAISSTKAEGSLDAIWAKKEIEISPWGGLYVTDTFRLVNTGNSTISGVEVNIANEAINVEAFDDLGTILFNTVDQNGSRSVQVITRYPLRGFSENQTYNDVYTFNVKYTLDFSLHISSLSFDRMRLTLFLTGDNISSSGWEVTIRLPEGATYELSNPTGVSKKEGLTTEIYLDFPSQIISLSLEYTFSPLWIVFRPTLWIGSATACVGMFVFLRTRRRAREETITVSRDFELVKPVIETLEDELVLWNEAEKLDKDLDKRSLSRKDYNRRKAIIEQRLRNLTKASENAMERLRRSDTDWSAVLGTIEKVQSEVAFLRSELNKFRSQLRRGKLSRKDFDELEEENWRRMSSARDQLEKVIIRLGDEVK